MVACGEAGDAQRVFFWPGSEAEIAGERPTYYLHFDNQYPDEKRIDQVIAWLKLPPEQRPHFITLYYSNVDHAVHFDRCRFALVLLLAAMTLGQPAAATAGDWFGLRKKAKPTPQSTSQPGPQQAAQTVPYTPRPNTVAAPPGPIVIRRTPTACIRGTATASACPRIPGAISAPPTARPFLCHFGYYGDFSQFGYRRGY